MWRTLILLLLINCSRPDKYEFLPEIEEGTAGLPVDKIVPQKNYEYWEYRFSDFSKDEVLCSGGVSLLKHSIKFENQTSGIFTECHPGLCIFYVMAVKDGKMEIIDSKDKLREFIGTIDNLEEVIISIKLNDYWFDPSDERTGTYRKTENGYDLQILDSESCPVKYKSVQATLDFNGKLEVHSIKIIREETDCVIS